jgi:DNA-binding response OmpR family regulator
LTAHALEEERREVLAAGCDDFVRKPFERKDVLERIAACLGREPARSGALDSNAALSDAGAGEAVPLTLENIPPDLLASLKSAAMELDVRGVRSCIDAIRPVDGEAARALGLLTDGFDFEAILKGAGGEWTK